MFPVYLIIMEVDVEAAVSATQGGLQESVMMCIK